MPMPISWAPGSSTKSFTAFDTSSQRVTPLYSLSTMEVDVSTISSRSTGKTSASYPVPVQISSSSRPSATGRPGHATASEPPNTGPPELLEELLLLPLFPGEPRVEPDEEPPEPEPLPCELPLVELVPLPLVPLPFEPLALVPPELPSTLPLPPKSPLSSSSGGGEQETAWANARSRAAVLTLRR